MRSKYQTTGQARRNYFLRLCEEFVKHGHPEIHERFRKAAGEKFPYVRPQVEINLKLLLKED